MTKKQDIWMPLYIADYLADTTRLSTEQHGAYLLIIMDYWRNGAPPDDDLVLANITRLQPAQWRKHKQTLSKLFTIYDGEWHHKRIDEELIKASENATKFADRAKKAADKRWNKDATSNATSIPNSKANALHEDMLADATSPSPSSITKSSNTQEDLTTVEPTKIASVCIAMKEIYVLNNKPPIDITQSDQTLIALINAGASVAEFTDATQSAINKGVQHIFKYAISTVKGQRENVKDLKLHKGALPPQTSREAGRQVAAQSIFTNEAAAHLRQPKVINQAEKEVIEHAKLN